MLEHLNGKQSAPERVVILGSGGFVGGAAKRLLEAKGVPVLGLARQDVDLTAAGASTRRAEAPILSWMPESIARGLDRKLAHVLERRMRLSVVRECLLGLRQPTRFDTWH